MNKTEESALLFYDGRIKTFHSWPFGDDTNCTAHKMAEAGFYAVEPNREPDLAKCFFCFKEMHWEETDDPWSEHVDHCPDCAFVKIGKKPYELTVYDYCKLLQDRAICFLEKCHEEKRAQLVEQYESVKAEIIDM